MQAEKKQKINQLRLRAQLPKIIGIIAIVGIGVTIAAILYSVYRSSQNPEFRMQGFPASLSKDVVATIDGYERREVDGDTLKYFIRADKAVSFADNHQELENVYLEVYNEDATAFDRISAQKAVYVPTENKNFTAYFAGTVNVETRDQLKVKTEQLTYDRSTEIATAEELVEFERANVTGSSTGATVNVRDKVIELSSNVEIIAKGSSDAEVSKLSAGKARYYQVSEKIELENGVTVGIGSDGDPARTTDLAAARAVAFLTLAEGEERTIDRVELFDNIRIASREGEKEPTRITSNYAMYLKPADRFELRDAVNIITAEGGNPTDIRAATAVYQQQQGLIDLNGDASITQTANFVRGDSIHAELNANKKVRSSEVKGNASVKQTTPERTTLVTGAVINAVFSDGQVLESAKVTGGGNAEIIPANQSEYSKIVMSAAERINVGFKGEGLLNNIDTEGRTNVRMESANNAPDASTKSLTADKVTTAFAPSGKDLTTAVASGNAELVVTPMNKSVSTYTTTIVAPRFECEFFATGNNPKLCTAATRTKTVRVPSQPAEGRGTQNLASEKLIAKFSPQGRDLDELEAIGDARFTELDRNASSERIIYNSTDQVVRLRGASPSVWDGKARAKASEIDWDTKNQTSELRGGASTTYYSPKSTGGATPFGRSEKPVYVTADNARFDHRAEVAVYSGNARGWQDNNYVRGERMTISEKDGRFVAEQNVQSLLYESKRVENGVESNQPIYAAAQKLTYDRGGRTLRYENGVDIRQGKDRITGGVANIYLTENNEPSKTEIEQNVVITQPNRKAAADFARYDTSSETLFLQGSPASVEDAEQGRSQAEQITLNLKENRFSGTTPAKQNSAGRTRSVYKIRNQ